MRTLDIMIETPKGCIEKYDYDAEHRIFRFKKALPLGMAFPYDFGFIPNTLGEDGDPLDALVISEFKFFPGCVVRCRLIGVMKAEQSEKKKTIGNDRFFFIPELSVQYRHIRSVADLPEKDIEQLKDFFVNYNKTEGKIFRPGNMLKPEKAYSLIKKQVNGIIAD
ncbi:MAG: inorganic diphosphatase [Chitinophagaceae bacterium]|nr:inorganic diphosphatase [Chitinophagaceae bacterium]